MVGGGLGLLMGLDPKVSRAGVPSQTQGGLVTGPRDDPADLCRVSFTQKYVIHGILPAASIGHHIQVYLGGVGHNQVI